MLKVKVNNGNEFTVNFEKENHLKGTLNNKEFSWDIQSLGQGTNAYHIIKDNLSYNASVLEIDFEKKSLVVSVRGNIYYVSVKDHYDELLSKLGIDLKSKVKTNEIKAPMPGLVKELKVNAGDEIKAGDTLLILEAMKMENIIKSPVDGIIKSVEVQKDKAVEKNQILIRFK